MSEAALVAVDGLAVHFPIRSGLLGRTTGAIKAVDGISFTIAKGETLGMVGESGCGKTTAGRAILQLTRPTAGRVAFRGTDLVTQEPEALRRTRRHMQMIFQDPYASLNPQMRVGEIIARPLRVHGVTRGDADERGTVATLMETVGLNPSLRDRYPHEFSGGQRQRIGIARALATNPDLIVCDEPISALDVSIQAQIVNLLERLREERGLTYLFIAHDLSMVRYLSTRVAVMYLGKLVELTSSAELYARPLHPYTQALLSAIPIPDPVLERARQRILLEGDVPSPANPPPGCRFSTRCPLATARCRQEEPAFREAEPGHFVACHLV
ncbi:ABC transporter ATP-binding protein [uncultured Alsobacter sp.]|uniref:ABC transporter ATP-binding protein n=1 Tax=uncultured Alsobacter sp. TaxID=1748258 RepID=UPI0025F0738D|nr:oligopeptide/dipeptide ABC transporter ATP-binding protein [uncultured Alsobacter sp.]